MLKQPSVSILVPARNEATNIGRCVSSLLFQDYPDFEVLVLDDHSTDETWTILTQLAAQDNRLRCSKGQPLPEHWLGKHWACHQLTQQAHGDLFLFTDADTYHHPAALADAVAIMQIKEVDLVTALPRQETLTWGEKLIVPLIPWSIGTFVPLALAYRFSWSSLAVGIGQFMLFTRTAYNSIGGHRAIKQLVVDDIALAQRVQAKGLRWRLMNGSQRIRCRMYRNFAQAREGLSKNLFSVFHGHISFFVFVWVWLFIVFIIPPFLLIVSLMGVSLLPIVTTLSILAICLALPAWGAIYWQFCLPLYLTFLYPLTIVMAVYLAARSFTLNLTGRATWKGRRLTKTAIHS
ncbi:glycosyltransferase family 2 protein [Chloroflexi bacterium TSY]|nr:glycosyltransferase family 2 protein [Chloroflexi bacterium TSY]